jgi:DNA-directed RNA polymerase subunit RPC12/RpoP
MTNKHIPLRVIKAPRVGHVMDAPPAFEASDHTIGYTCGRCETILLHAEADQVQGLIIRCTKCGSYNCATGSLG